MPVQQMKFGSRANFHTHTFRCRHASGTVDDMCQAAIAAGLDTLGMSDHGPFPDDRLQGSRMPFAEAEAYAREVAEAREKYAGRLRVLFGFEVDYFPSLGNAFYEDIFIGRLHCDYLISGTHFIEGGGPGIALWEGGRDFGPGQVRRYIDVETEALETGLFKYVAHPDMFSIRCAEMTPAIADVCNVLLDAAEALRVPLEVNAYGLRKSPISLDDGTTRPQYPWRPFWDLVREHGGIRAVVGADAHRPEDVWSNVDETIAWAAESGIEVDNIGFAKEIFESCGRSSGT